MKKQAFSQGSRSSNLVTRNKLEEFSQENNNLESNNGHKTKVGRTSRELESHRTREKQGKEISKEDTVKMKPSQSTSEDQREAQIKTEPQTEETLRETQGEKASK
jgi:hypothetical protein